MRKVEKEELYNLQIITKLPGKSSQIKTLTTSMTNFQILQEEKKIQSRVINFMKNPSLLKVVVAGKSYDTERLQTMAGREARILEYSQLRRSASSKIHQYHIPQATTTSQENIGKGDDPGQSMQTKESVQRLLPNYQTKEFSQAIKDRAQQSSFDNSNSLTNMGENTPISVSEKEIFIRDKPIFK